MHPNETDTDLRHPNNLPDDDRVDVQQSMKVLQSMKRHIAAAEAALAAPVTGDLAGDALTGDALTGDDVTGDDVTVAAPEVSRKTAANRRNAQKSTGPRTEAGKRIVSTNALTHGLTGQKLLFQEDEHIHYLRTAQDLMGYLLPVGPLEVQLAQRIIDTNFQWSRAQALELNLFTVGTTDRFYDENKNDPATDLIVSSVRWHEKDCSGPNALDKIGRHTGRLQRLYFKSLDEFYKMQTLRQKHRPNSTVTSETCSPRRMYATMVDQHEHTRAARQAKRAEEAKQAADAAVEATAPTQLEAKATQLIENGTISELALFCGELAGVLGKPAPAVPKRGEKEAA